MKKTVLKKLWTGLTGLVMSFTMLSAQSVIPAHASMQDDIVNVALGEVGYVEGYNNDNKYGEEFGSNHAPWCAIFIWWCAQHAGIDEDIIARNVSAANMEGTKRKGNFGGEYYPRSMVLSGEFFPERGDIVYYDGEDVNGSSGHVELVIDYDASNGTISSVGGNTGVGNKQEGVARHDSRSIYTTGTALRIVGFERPYYIDVPPTYAKLDKNQVWYDLKDEIILTPSSDHAVDFFISIRKDNQTVVSDHVNRGETFRYRAEQFGAGNYFAWISAANSAGSVDSEGIDFSIVDGVGYSNIYSSKSAYSVNDDVSVTVDTICAKGQVIGIDKIGEGRKITENCDSTFSVPAKNLGTGLFGAYFSVYNGSQSVDTKWEFFSIDNETEKPQSAELKADKENYVADDKITLSPSSPNALVYWLGVRKDGKDIINTKITSDYSFNANKYGNGVYYAWISAVNSCGSTDSEGIRFSVGPTATTGDVNDDGSIDLKDVTLMRRALAGWHVTVNETAADVNKDNSFDLKDIVILRRYLAGGWDITL